VFAVHVRVRRVEWAQEEYWVFSVLKAYWLDENGVTSLEYALLLALCVVASIAAWRSLGTKVNSVADQAAGNFPSNGGGCEYDP